MKTARSRASEPGSTSLSSIRTAIRKGTPGTSVPDGRLPAQIEAGVSGPCLFCRSSPVPVPLINHQASPLLLSEQLCGVYERCAVRDARKTPGVVLPRALIMHRLPCALCRFLAGDRASSKLKGTRRWIWVIHAKSRAEGRWFPLFPALPVISDPAVRRHRRRSG